MRAVREIVQNSVTHQRMNLTARFARDHTISISRMSQHHETFKIGQF